MNKPLTPRDFENALKVLREAKPDFSPPVDYLPAPRHVGQKMSSYFGLPYRVVRINNVLTWEEDVTWEEDASN